MTAAATVATQGGHTLNVPQAPKQGLKVCGRDATQKTNRPSNLALQSQANLHP
jgi:hypothetical protein